ncbi:MAG TPA: hypothetical protein VHH88_07655 [Verrucomicrobiae bacterium]|nr:hypothetical protein [Verrucomicrobiae bacterium]
MKPSNNKIELNWGKLLGFNQVRQAQGSLKTKSARALVGAKIGTKAGGKPVV